MDGVITNVTLPVVGIAQHEILANVKYIYYSFVYPFRSTAVFVHAHVYIYLAAGVT